MKRWLLAACTSILLAQAVPLAAQAQAVSADGRWRAQAEGHTLVLVDLTTGLPVRTLQVRALDGSGASAVAEIHAVAARRSFVLVFRTLAEMWEVSLDPQAGPIYDGYVHDYRMGEGIAIPGFLNPRRTRLDAPLRGLRFDRSGAFVLGRAPDRAGPGPAHAVLQVWQLDVRRRLGEQVVAGDPDPAGARDAVIDGRAAVLIPDRAGGPAITLEWHRP